MYKVHMWLESRSGGLTMVMNRRLESIPRVGDTVRLPGTTNRPKVARVTEIVWCYDEESLEGQRVNIRVEELS